ncbi:disease resistance-like protein DSC1 isoform X2 [Pistacia vera]|uniref:disease resistance-like protein DSC1 isoform X2 n=1 Tax=Pistacia vera TaxID=55513 RepID=UPI001263DB47|nr:disease resistance-like protein DSC1 isoform X2 [Pistacia vera]
MASSSSSSSSSTTPKLKYEVFLSFRDEETQKNFRSHLYDAFSRENINTFIDDKLNRGEEISPALLTAIEQSKISVIILSKGYGSSSWCLKELEKIVECKKKYSQILIPIFYHVDPSDVRKQTGDFGKAFSQLEERFKVDDPEMLQRWKTALTDIGNLSGFTSDNTRDEASLVKNIVENILKKLNDECSEIDNENPVGLDSTIEQIENLLCTKGVRRLGIWGIGAIGKTTLACAVIRKISEKFAAHYFIQNIREESEKSGGLNDLHRSLMSAVFGDKYPGIEFTLKRKRLDSRIIITARDEHVLEECEVDPKHIIKMVGLSDDEAFQLFNHYAFRGNSPTEDCIELSSRAVAYAEGVPLALRVLGSSLFGKTKKVWESTLENLKRDPDMDIHNVLKVSYDGLDGKQKEVFLDIACFFKGCERALIEEVLDANYGFGSHNYINVLIERSLITTLSKIITMHDLLQAMGREIVRQESSNNPAKCSRLWDHEEIYSVLTTNKGKGTIRSISLDMSKAKEIRLRPKAFNKMHNLRFLKAYGFTHGNKVYGFEHLEFDFSELRYLSWFNYSAKSLPQYFNPENLVALYLTDSKLERLWTSVKNLNNLKHIDLSHSKHLLEMPNLLLCPNLKSLILQGCINLHEDFSSIRYLNKLVLLNLKECKSFESLPINPGWKYLQRLILSKCSNLKTVPHIPDTVEELYLDGTGIKDLSSLKHLSNLEILNLENCSELESLPQSIGESENLRIVILSNCSKIKTVPCIPRSVEELYLDGTAIEELPPLEHLSKLVILSLKNCLRLESLTESICEVKSLQCLYLSGSSKLDRLPNGLKNLKALEELEVEGVGITDISSLSLTCLNNLKKLSLMRCGLQKPPVNLACHKLEQLNLENCCIEVLPKNLGELHSLTFLYLGGNNFDSLPDSIKDLSMLYELDLSNCERLKSIPQLPDNSLRIQAKGCTSLEAVSGLPTQCLSMGTDNEEISFINCCNLKLDLTDTLPNIERNADLWFSSEENTTFLLSRVNLEKAYSLAKAYSPPMAYSLAKAYSLLPKAYSLAKAYSLPKASICYPGSEIPAWFTFTSQNGHIEFPSDWLNDDLIGFAFCAVASFRDYEEAGALQVRCHLFVNGVFVSAGCLFNGYGHEVIESDHVFLGYDYDIMSLELLSVRLNSKDYVEFFVEHESTNCKEKRKVKKCGVRLLYTKYNDKKTDARVKRDRRFQTIKGCLRCHLHCCVRCYLHCCVKHDEMDEYKPSEILNAWSPHPEIYKPPIRRDYSVYIWFKVYAHLVQQKRMDQASKLEVNWNLLKGKAGLILCEYANDLAEILAHGHIF